MSDVLNTILSTILIPLLTAVAGYFIAFLRKKTSEIENKIDHSTTERYIDIFENTIETCVMCISQTYVNKMKQAGLFDPGAQAEAFELCKQKILSILSDDVKLALTQVFGDMETLIDTKIEYYVNKQKSLIQN
ncbi:MAG: hypothetical protein N2484_02700 [Clostridia bacterium]|nr:hypothetical protein [Clostridia bacterium]